MTARPEHLLSRWWVGLLLLIAGTLAGVAIGCSTPRERYQTLSIFFDGVPNPDAPRPKAASTQLAAEKMVFVSAIQSRHKPYVEKRCDACHRSASGNIMEFDEAWKACLGCHKKVPTEHARMHGPVAVASTGTGTSAQPTCRWCHTPHESHEPALLKENAVKVCTQCHDTQLLGAKPVQHQDGTSCIQCHYGHGGALTNAHFLKPGAVPEWPATRPATRPATQPAATRPDVAGLLTRRARLLARQGVGP